MIIPSVKVGIQCDTLGYYQQPVGGDRNHGLDYDFPFSWEVHHTDELRGVGQPPTSIYTIIYHGIAMKGFKILEAIHKLG
jgi:hypothetical protein